MEITFNEVEHRYGIHTPFERLAIYDLNLDIKPGAFSVIVGHTGSGKSTVIQHLNGLLKPTSGSVTIGDYTITSETKNKQLKPLRKDVGVVFQFPEYQLFEETVEKDICFGPMNFGVSVEEAKKIAKEVIVQVGLSEEFLTRSPFELSGGQMRRVAIAGILAMRPKVLVLDEPTAGLDPSGQRELMEMFYHIHKTENIAVVLVTHQMEDAAKYGEQIIVMNKGAIAMSGTPASIFSQEEKLREMGIDIPITVRMQRAFEQQFQASFSTLALNIETVAEEIARCLKRGET
ncbi:MAG: energy-coupling factor ABC transporter ATP-binding protein [Bacillaceae bacterium]